MELKTRLVYYPGHLGERTRVALRDPLRGLAFEAGQVRKVPILDAFDLFRLSGFLEALPLTEAATRFGVPESTLKELQPRLSRVHHKELGELLLLDGATLSLLLGVSPSSPRAANGDAA